MTLKLERTGPATAVATRHFNAPPERVFAAHTDPALLRHWLLGPDGWEMTRCESDPRPGGAIRYDWAPVGGGEGGFHLTAEYLAVEPPHRLVHVERMFLPDPTPDVHVETLFQAEGTGTRLVMTLTAPSPEAMDGMLASGMEHGMEASYARLDGMA